MTIVIAAAWLVAVLAEVTGRAAAIHHDALIEGGVPLSIALPLSTAGWLVMVVAMMLPASRSFITASVGARRGRGNPLGPRPALGWPPVPGPTVRFLAGFLVVWAGVGVAAFLGDAALHQLVDTLPWLAAHAWVVAATSLAAAGVYQWTPWKRRALIACRDVEHAAHGGAAMASGWRHGLDCVAASGPLMLLMFAAGLADLVWMVALTALMAYETGGRAGLAAARIAGIVLVVLAAHTAALGLLGGAPG